MPYIDQKSRRQLRNGCPPNSVGELNYRITELLLDYVLCKGLCYQTLAEVTAATSDALAEFRRRIANPYEDKKIAENGDLPLYATYTDVILARKEVTNVCQDSQSCGCGAGK